MWQVGIIALGVFGVAIFANNVVPNDLECGILPTDMTPEGTQPHHLPWVVRVGYHDRKDEKILFKCVGSLISHQIVLTTAHCVHHVKPLMVQLRDCDEKNCNKTRNINVSTILTHPAYTPLDPSFVNDIALIKLDNDAHDSSKVGQHVCLPKSTFQTYSLLGSKLVVAGWKIHEKGTEISSKSAAVLRTITVSPVSDKKCKIQYGQKIQIHTSHLCATGAGKEPCFGDSGAPLHSIQGSPPQAVLTGIVEIGSNNCANAFEPTIYTNVGAHVQWIKDSMIALQ